MFQSIYYGAPLGYQQISSLSSSTALTVPAGATFALIECEAQAVRWRGDAVAPTTTVGMNMAVADVPLPFAGDLRNYRFIEVTSGAKLNIEYYGVAGVAA